VRHIPTAFRHDPLFVLRNARKMLTHTFRGTTWRSICGLESSSDVFARYRAIRAEERKYLDWPDPAPGADEGPARPGPSVSPLSVLKAG
jgi:hypothetical protein